MRRLLAIVLVLLLAGCTRPEPRPAILPEPEPESEPEPAQTIVFAALPTARLLVSLDVVDRWVRPEDTVLANATARASSFEWYLAERNPLARVPDAGPFALARGGALTLDVRRAGRHVFALDASDARLNVSIVPGALPLRLDARLVDEGEGARFAPDELVGGPGSVIALSNDALPLATVRRVEQMMPLPESGRTIHLRMPDHVRELGDYDLVVVARDGAGAVGEASARIVYDNRKPEANQTFGPWQGTFRAPALPGRSEPVRHAWWNARTLTSLDVTFTATSGLPAPAAVRVTLVDASGASIASADAGGFHVASLASGDHAIVVELLEGALVSYEVQARGVWDLTPPRSFFPE
ncbi:MAG TPA: hypothetical protein VM370_06100 [Candidatus Thermoplasmatota archaeon]|nr:hypothetical protein [Candidatus Thermoplasmatota archaeon]